MITFSNQDTVMMKQYEKSIFVIVHCPRRFRAVVVLPFVCIISSRKPKKEYLPILKPGSRL